MTILGEGEPRASQVALDESIPPVCDVDAIVELCSQASNFETGRSMIRDLSRIALVLGASALITTAVKVKNFIKDPS